MDRISKSNNHQITIKQHVIPASWIKRFIGKTGKVEVCRWDKNGSAKRLCAGPRDSIFHSIAVTNNAGTRVKRTWNQWAEKGQFKTVEDKFGKIAAEIPQSGTISPDQRIWVMRAFAVWLARFSAQYEDRNPTTIPGICPVSSSLGYSQDEIEHLEALRFLTFRTDGTVSGVDTVSHVMHGHWQMLSDRLGIKNWGVLKAEEGEFVFPDSCWVRFPFRLLAEDPGAVVKLPEFQTSPLDTFLTILPITPKVLLMMNVCDQSIYKAEVSELNRHLLGCCRNFVFARSFAHCPIRADGIKLPGALTNMDKIYVR